MKTALIGAEHEKLKHERVKQDQHQHVAIVKQVQPAVGSVVKRVEAG